MLFDIILKYSICCERTIPSLDGAASTQIVLCSGALLVIWLFYVSFLYLSDP